MSDMIGYWLATAVICFTAACIVWCVLIRPAIERLKPPRGWWGFWS